MFGRLTLRISGAERLVPMRKTCMAMSACILLLCAGCLVDSETRKEFKEPKLVTTAEGKQYVVEVFLGDRYTVRPYRPIR